MADSEMKDIKPNMMPVAPISNPFSPEEEKANAEYRAMTRRAGEAMRVLAKDGTSTAKNTEHQEALLGDARSIAEAKIAKTLKAAVDGAKLQADASEHAIETFARDFKRGVMLDLWENYVPRSPHQAELNLDFEAFSLAVCSEGRLSIDGRVDAGIRRYIKPTAGKNSRAEKRVVKGKAKRKGERQCDSTLLKGHSAVSVTNAARAMGILQDSVNRLIRQGRLETTGKGQYKKVTTASIRKYCGIEESST
jgi:hypothetical protein